MDRVHPPAIVRKAADLRILATEINSGHEASQGALRRSLESAYETGLKLNKAKDLVGHRGWKPWLDENVEFSQRTASDYMRVANNWPKLAAAANLRDALRLLTEDGTDADESARNPAPVTAG